MPTIGLIDDRFEQRDTMRNRIIRALKNGGHEDWKVVQTDPFYKVEDYIPWIDDEEIGVLITDQKLNEVPSRTTGEATTYAGHDIIAYIRPYRPQLPIYVVTSFNDDVGLDEERDKYEFAIEREHFRRDIDKLITVMVRSGTQYLKQHTDQLGELSLLSDKAATGQASEEELQRIGILQLAVKHNYGFPEAAMKAELLDGFEEQIGAFEKLIKDLKLQLQKDDSQ